jgi:MOSC domain-containing protein YiiM
MARVVQVNVKPRSPAEGGLAKHPVASASVDARGVEGDFNHYRHDELHDEADSAVLLMPRETIEALDREGWPVRPGDLGENLTTEGVAYAAMGPGRRLQVGEIVLEVTRACDPCTNLYKLPYVGPQKGPAFLKVMLGRRGWYAKVLRPGTVHPGDAIELLEGPA